MPCFANTVVMIRPKLFYSNEECIEDNTLMQTQTNSNDEINAKAQAEFTRYKSLLIKNGIKVVEF